MVIFLARITLVNINSQTVQVLGFILLGRMPKARNGIESTPRSGTGTCICCQQPTQIFAGFALMVSFPKARMVSARSAWPTHLKPSFMLWGSQLSKQALLNSNMRPPSGKTKFPTHIGIRLPSPMATMKSDARLALVYFVEETGKTKRMLDPSLTGGGRLVLCQSAPHNCYISSN